MAVCLATSLATAVVAANAFTLAWTHSIERVRWEGGSLPCDTLRHPVQPAARVRCRDTIAAPM